MKKNIVLFIFGSELKEDGSNVKTIEIENIPNVGDHVVFENNVINIVVRRVFHFINSTQLIYIYCE